MAKNRKSRIRAARGGHAAAAQQPDDQAKRGADPLREAHVHVPRWRPPISATPEDEETASIRADDDLSDDDDTLEFERPRPII